LGERGKDGRAVEEVTRFLAVAFVVVEYAKKY
jgi:hypothetical protein